MAKTNFIPTATIIKAGKGDYQVVTKKSFLAKEQTVEKHFKTQNKAIDWCYANGFTKIQRPDGNGGNEILMQP